MVVANIRIFTEILRIQKQPEQNLHSEGCTKNMIFVHHLISASI